MGYGKIQSNIFESGAAGLHPALPWMHDERAGSALRRHPAGHPASNKALAQAGLIAGGCWPRAPTKQVHRDKQQELETWQA